MFPMLKYIMKRSIPDIETAISFLCKRVSKCDNQDWKKLKRVLAWLKGSINDIRYFGLKNNSILEFWDDIWGDLIVSKISLL